MCVMRIFGGGGPRAQTQKSVKTRAASNAQERTGQNLTGTQRGARGGSTLLSTAFNPATDERKTLLGQ